VRAELPSIHIRLLNALASYLAQRSSGTVLRRPPTRRIWRRCSCMATSCSPDGNTRAAALVRRITRSPWSHVSMYVGPLETGPDPRCIVEADIATGVRAVRLSELKGLRVRVLRRRGLDDAQRRQLADWVVSRIGGQYDLTHALALAKRLLLLPLASRLAPAPVATAHAATRFICSTLLAHAFLLVGSPIVPDHSYVTPRDFETAAGLEPVATARRQVTEIRYSRARRRGLAYPATGDADLDRPRDAHRGGDRTRGALRPGLHRHRRRCAREIRR
jgi:hypothetical protein